MNVSQILIDKMKYRTRGEVIRDLSLAPKKKTLSRIDKENVAKRLLNDIAIREEERQKRKLDMINR